MKKEEAKTNKKNVLEERSAELHEPRWSVISFTKPEASGLTYAQAEQKLKELEAQNISGLCIVTDEVVSRMVQ